MCLGRSHVLISKSFCLRVFAETSLCFGSSRSIEPGFESLVLLDSSSLTVRHETAPELPIRSVVCQIPEAPEVAIATSVKHMC